jgi:hypothetical protein
MTDILSADDLLLTQEMTKRMSPLPKYFTDDSDSSSSLNFLLSHALVPTLPYPKSIG